MVMVESINLSGFPTGMETTPLLRSGREEDDEETEHMWRPSYHYSSPDYVWSYYWRVSLEGGTVNMAPTRFTENLDFSLPYVIGSIIMFSEFF